MKTSSKKLILFLALVSAGLAAGYGMMYLELLKQNSEVSEINKRVDDYTMTAASVVAVEKALQETKDEVQNVDSLYISADGTVEFLKTLETLARQNNLEVTIASVETADVNKETKTFQEYLRIRLSASGSWSDVYKFIFFLKNLPYKINLDTVSLIVTDDEAEISVWRADFLINVLKLK